MVLRRRERQWFTSATGFTGLAAGDQTDVQLYNATIHGPRFMKGATVQRMIINMTIRSPSLAENNTLFWGIVVVNEDARIAGALPEADDTADRADWLVRGRLQNITSSVPDGSQWTHRNYDIRSGRTLRSEEDGLLMILDNLGSFTVEFSQFTRVLMLMP